MRGTIKVRGGRTEIVALESDEHLTLCEWLDKHGVFYIHIPNEGERSVHQTVMLKRMGMKKGAPDFIIPGPENIAIELKRSDKTMSRVSKEQRECLMILSQLGWKTQICYGAANAIGYLMNCHLQRKSLKSIPTLTLENLR